MYFLLRKRGSSERGRLSRWKRSLIGVCGGAEAMARGFDFRGPMQQLSQVSQQAMATGDVMTAVAIQAPDIGLAFGPVGIALGVVAGLALPLAGDLLGVGEAGVEAGEGVDEFTEALKVLLADDRLRAQMGRNGRQYVKTNYRWDVIMQKYEGLMAALKA